MTNIKKGCLGCGKCMGSENTTTLMPPPSEENELKKEPSLLGPVLAFGSAILAFKLLT